jgi:hypothetical protein
MFESENRRIFSDLSQISTTLKHGFHVRARRASTESPTARRVMTIKHRLKIHSPMHLKVDGLSTFRLAEARRQGKLVKTIYFKCSRVNFSVSHSRRSPEVGNVST